MSGTILDADQRPTLLAALPSSNYDSAKSTLVYRLSELTFGSILAAYIFGFLSLSASVILTASDSAIFVDYFLFHSELIPVAIQVLIYVFISGTFAYYSIALFMRYHSGILTMPTVPVESLRIDVTIAVLQAAMFGTSMLIPPSFFLCVAIVLWAAAWRQNREFGYLVDYFTTAIQLRNSARTQANPGSARSLREAQEAISIQVEATIKASWQLGWRPVSRKYVLGALELTAIGILLLLLPFLQYLEDMFPLLRFIGIPPVEWLRMIYLLGSLVLFILMLIGVYNTVREAAHFMLDPVGRRTLDDAYVKVEDALLKLSSSSRNGLQP